MITSITKKKIFYTVLFLIAAIITTTVVKKNGELKKPVIGMMNGWHPFMTFNAEKNRFEGFDIDVVKELEKELGIQFEIRDLGSLDSLFIALEQGSIDIIMSGLDITNKRKEKYHMIRYAGAHSNTISYVSKKEIYDITNSSICIEGGCSISDVPATLGIKKIIYTSSLSEMIMNIEYEKTDGIIVENHVAETILQSKPLWYTKKIEVPEEFRIDGMGILLKKNNTTLAPLLEKAIKKLRIQNIIQKLESKWNIV